MHGINDLVDFCGGFGRTLGQRAHLVSHYSKTAALLASPCSLNGGVKCQQVGLLGNAANHFQYFADAASVVFQAADDLRGVADLAANIGDGFDRRLHHRFTLARSAVGIVGGIGSFGCVARHFLGGGGHFMHRRGHLVGARELLTSALSHERGDGVEFATGGVEVGGAALQAGKGVGQKVAQNIGCGGQLAELILAR